MNEWAKKAVLLFFRVRGLETTDVGPFEYHDKLPLKSRVRGGGRAGRAAGHRPVRGVPVAGRRA